MPEEPAKDYRQRLLRFVSDAAHDLIGPVDQVSSLVALFVRRYQGQLDAEAQNLLTHIESAGGRLAITAAGLRSYFKVAGTEFGRTRVNSRTALESALLISQQEIRESHAEINFGELPDVEGDANLLVTLFHALIQNSLKFRRTGVHPRILVAVECTPPACRFSIVDNGMGIDPRYQEDVFLAFKKLNGHSYPGAGMGLTMARAIVEILGGKIWIAATGDPGTTVIFELPAAR